MSLLQKQWKSDILNITNQTQSAGNDPKLYCLAVFPDSVLVEDQPKSPPFCCKLPTIRHELDYMACPTPPVVCSG